MAPPASTAASSLKTTQKLTEESNEETLRKYFRTKVDAAQVGEDNCGFMKIGTKNKEKSSFWMGISENWLKN